MYLIYDAVAHYTVKLFSWHSNVLAFMCVITTVVCELLQRGQDEMLAVVSGQSLPGSSSDAKKVNSKRTGFYGTSV